MILAFNYCRTSRKYGNQIHPCLFKDFHIPVSDAYLGRVMNALAQPIDRKGWILGLEKKYTNFFNLKFSHPPPPPPYLSLLSR